MTEVSPAKSYPFFAPLYVRGTSHTRYYSSGALSLSALDQGGQSIHMYTVQWHISSRPLVRCRARPPAMPGSELPRSCEVACGVAVHVRVGGPTPRLVCMGGQGAAHWTA